MDIKDQRIAVAETCGFLQAKFGPDLVPEYPSDLNAIQAAIVDHICGDMEKEAAFLKELKAIIDGYADSEDVPIIIKWEMALLCAPAWALCKAFLKAVGKWKE